MCLLCNERVSSVKEYNLKQHLYSFNRKHNVYLKFTNLPVNSIIGRWVNDYAAEMGLGFISIFIDSCNNSSVWSWLSHWCTMNKILMTVKMHTWINDTSKKLITIILGQKQWITENNNLQFAV